jgi:acylphosphatase
MAESSERRAMRYTVTGRVQGVGFRYFVQRAATELGVTGSVRNRADGSVEVHAEAEAETLDRLAQRLRQGPALARVDHVASAPAPLQCVTEFRIAG